MSTICPKCQRVMKYDPYFKANICRQCGTAEKINMIELSSRKIIEVKNNKIINKKMVEVQVAYLK